MPDNAIEERQQCAACGNEYHDESWWACPATPLWAETCRAVRVQDIGIVVWALTSLPLQVISDPWWLLHIDQESAAWTVARRTEPLYDPWRPKVCR
jgi:hypothetical protein